MLILVKVTVNFEIYIANRKATTGIGNAFLLRCVNPAALPLVCAATRFAFPGG